MIQQMIKLFIGGFFGGLAAFLMPCIFPMLPLTVSYFTKRHISKSKGIRDAIIYGLSIILIYVGLGMFVSICFGASALNNIATNGIFNLFFFVLLVVFAASFLGAFEIILPNRWINNVEDNTTKKGFTGIFFMAAVLALVSFSCTGPIIGTLLVQAATGDQTLGPVIGMLGFGIALSLPFVIFAMFPAALNSLPKSGGWLNTIKVTLGFLELALSLKFLSNVDLVYHWHWFDREVFLVLWILIFGCWGMYLLGKLKLNHDSENNGIGVPRLFSGIIVCAFSLFMVPGLWGAPLKSIAAFLPPQDTQDFDLYTPSLSKGTVSTPVKIKEVRWGKLFHAPLNLPAFFDYEEGMAYAKSAHKPVLIDFTGHACVNCRKMEATIWPDKNVLPPIRDQYVLIQLYVDDKTLIKDGLTIGKQNSKLQETQFNSNSQPDYVLLDDNEKLLVAPQGAIYDPAAYAAYLQSGLDEFKKRNQAGSR
ncbi:MAG: Protein-disulfide reductase [Mucilaginibacter sp.]|nr:Protein-disulfide reductase [Mucilaginibacter sp.]